jgi:hypothetical protein
MKWTFIIQQKLKLSLLLGCIVFLIIITILVEKQNIKDMDKSMTSIYKDRLIPATDIFYLTQKIFTKQLLIERFLNYDSSFLADALTTRLRAHNDSIQLLITRFEKTYLVENETEYLSLFKTTLTKYNLEEERLLQIAGTKSIESARTEYQLNGKKLISEAVHYLEKLTKIQSKVAEDLTKDSHSVVLSSDSLVSLQIGLAIVISLLIQALIISSKAVNRPKQPFHLN